MNSYVSCEDLPVRSFFKIFETNDLRHLLSSPKKRLTKSDISALNESWEAIINEYEVLTHDNVYSDQMKISNDRQRKINRLIGIKGAMMLYSVNQDKGREALAFWRIKVGDDVDKEVLRVRNILLSEQTRLSINIVQDKPDDEKVNFFEYWSGLQGALGYQASHESVSVAEWVGIINTMKSRKNGRN